MGDQAQQLGYLVISENNSNDSNGPHVHYGLDQQGNNGGMEQYFPIHTSEHHERSSHSGGSGMESHGRPVVDTHSGFANPYLHEEWGEAKAAFSSVSLERLPSRSTKSPHQSRRSGAGGGISESS